MGLCTVQPKAGGQRTSVVSWVAVLIAQVLDATAIAAGCVVAYKDENGRTRSKKLLNRFLLLHLKYESESESESGQTGHENEHELIEYLEFQK